MLSKQELRRVIKHKLQSSMENSVDGGVARGATVGTIKEQRNANLNSRLLQLVRKLSAATPGKHVYWAAFQPTGFEPDIRPLFQELKQEVRWSFPRVEGDELSFYLTDSHSIFSMGSYQILEPTPDPKTRISSEQLTGLLIPGVAFDAQGGRLGRGAGYYDRALAHIQTKNPKVIKIGVAFAPQIHTEPLPLEPFDIPMNWVVTDEGELQTSHPRGLIHE